MGEFLQAVAARQNSPEALAHRVALRLSQSANVAFILEAGDDIFYYSSLASRLGLVKKIDFYEAAGRQKVIDTMTVLDDLCKISRSYAIIDRDYNFEDPQYLFDEHCLVLNVYSFENFFMDSEFLETLCMRFFGFEAESEHTREWKISVLKLIEQLPASLQQEHLVAIWCRINQKCCYLENFSINAALDIYPDGSITRKADAYDNFIKSTKADIEKFTDEEKIKTLAIWLNLPMSASFRGHYFWDIFVKFLNRFREKADIELKNAGRGRSRTRSDIGSRHAIETSVAHSEMPEIVSTFICGAVAA